MSDVLADALAAEICRLLPDFGEADLQDGLVLLTAPEPCEQCGTHVVLIQHPNRQGRHLHEVTAGGLAQRLRTDEHGKRTALLHHHRERCRRARELVALPDLDALFDRGPVGGGS